MPDLFVSYASEDRFKISALVRLFESAGWSVWWDADIEGGRRWGKEIEDQLAASRCVMVCWSRASVTKEWVLKEAKAALDRDVLVPVLLEPVIPPEEFGQVQAFRLTTWAGEEKSYELRPLVQRIASVLGTPPPIVDDAIVDQTSLQIARTEVAEATFSFCAARLEFLRRQARGQAIPEELTGELGETYEDLADALAPITDEQLHDLIHRFQHAFTP